MKLSSEKQGKQMKNKRRDGENQLAADEVSVHEAARQLGRRGGQSTLARRGKDFFREIGAKGGKRQKELYSDLLAEFGKLGGRPRRPNLNESIGEGGHHKKGED